MYFKQSVNDFPLTVSLEEKIPVWELTRRGKQGLRFVPSDDEGFTLRGNKRQLLYKGRRRSHRFTIHSDTAFEYDCILNREPDSNTIVLQIEGGEHYDFFRQPDFISNPFLAGSYAVYKKEIVVGKGTGKLCHIHRPKIIDAEGKWCWGDLAITGNELYITIPEEWLGEAVYPVTVDPVIGTSVIGSQIPEIYTPSYQAVITYEYAVNKFVVPETISGECTAHFYLSDYEIGYGYFTPLLFEDNNGKPLTRRSHTEDVVDCAMWYIDPVNGYSFYPSHWKTGKFNVIDSIEEGSNIWFGGYGDPFYTVFDYGGMYYKNYPNSKTPDFPNNGQEVLYDFLISWYFEFESSSQNYLRTLTQGVTLPENQIVKMKYSRTFPQMATCAEATVISYMYVRLMVVMVTIKETLQQWAEYIRKLLYPLENSAEVIRSGNYHRKTETTVQVQGTVFRGLLLHVTISVTSFVRDYIVRRFLKAKEEIVLKSCITRELIIDSKIT